jgi:hypothetical protein
LVVQVRPLGAISREVSESAAYETLVTGQRWQPLRIIANSAGLCHCPPLPRLQSRAHRRAHAASNRKQPGINLEVKTMSVKLRARLSAQKLARA